MTKCGVIMLCFNVFGDLPSRCPISSVRVSAIPSALQLKGAFRCGREDCGPFVEVLVVGDVRLDSRHRPVAKRAPRMPLTPRAASTETATDGLRKRVLKVKQGN